MTYYDIIETTGSKARRTYRKDGKKQCPLAHVTHQLSMALQSDNLMLLKMSYILDSYANCQQGS